MKEALKKILIKSKKEAFSEIIGNNTSSKKGEGYDFAELKEYEYGDDVKNIDWLISAKMQKPYTKVFHAQKEQNVKIVNLLSGSLYFGVEKFKKDLLVEISSILGFICVKQSDPFTSYILNEKLKLCTKKSKKTFSVNHMADKLYDYDVLNKNINYELLNKELFKQINHKSIIFLIGDFFDIEKLNLKLLAAKHEIYVLIIRDKFEENPLQMGNVNFIDPISNSTFEGILNKNTVKQYQKQVEKNDHILYTHLQNASVKFAKFYTNEEILPKLAGLFR